MEEEENLDLQNWLISKNSEFEAFYNDKITSDLPQFVNKHSVKSSISYKFIKVSDNGILYYLKRNKNESQYFLYKRENIKGDEIKIDPRAGGDFDKNMIYFQPTWNDSLMVLGLSYLC